MAKLERDVLYEDSDFEIDSDEQSKLPYDSYQSTTNESTTVGSVVEPQFHSTKKPLNKSERKRQIPSQLSEERPQIPKFWELLMVEDHIP